MYDITGGNCLWRRNVGEEKIVGLARWNLPNSTRVTNSLSPHSVHKKRDNMAVWFCQGGAAYKGNRGMEMILWM